MIARALAALLFAPALSAAADYPFTYQRVQVADGIHAFIEPFGHAIVSGNTVAIIGEDAVAIVDTGHHPRLARAIAAEIRALTPKPVRYVVNTHWHNDHVSGNSVFAEAFPGVTVIAHAFTAGVLGKDIREFQGPNCVAFVRDADAGIEDCAEFRFRGADVTFDGRMTLKLGMRDVEVIHWGRGNTGGDIVAWVPDAKVLAAGDLVVHPFPFATQSYISEWAAVLRKLEATPFEALIPGHGPVMRDRRYLAEIRDVMESIMAQARAAYRPGMTADELRKLIDLKEFRSRIAGDNALIGANFDYMIGNLAVGRAWQELAGQWETEGLPAL